MIERANRLEFGVWRWIHEVDGVRNAILDRKLDRVDVVAQRGAERAHIVNDAHSQLRRKIIRIVDVLFARKIRLARIVGHDHHVFLADAVTTDELIELDSFLERHTQRSGLIIFNDQLFQ